MPKVLVRRLGVSRGELVGEGLRSDSVDGPDKVRIVDGGIPALDGPHRLAQCPHRRRRVEHNLRSVQPKTHPVQGVVPPVADVHADLGVLRVEDGVPGVALHVVGGLVEVVDSWNVVLPVLANDVARVADHHSSVPHLVAFLRVPFQDGRHDHHVPLPRQFLDLHHAFARLHILGKLRPLLLPRAKRKRHVPRFLQAAHLNTRLSGEVDHLLDLVYQSLLLHAKGLGRGHVDGVLNHAHNHLARLPQLLLSRLKLKGLDVQIQAFLPEHFLRLNGPFPQRHGAHRLALVQPVEQPSRLAQLFFGKVLF
mmetsp:Transcript_12601/g.28623  ORF Transcript_12601/g.28623 Transcript_12601/m.28623 type:complete len:308 (+) Transcript_12601:289-1212(+)